MNSAMTDNDMSKFVEVCSAEDIPDPGHSIFEIEGTVVVLFHVHGSWYCLEDVCTHDGGPLGEGRLKGFEIACPRHGARFDVRTGAPLSMPATEATSAYDVQVQEGKVWVSRFPRSKHAASGNNPATSTNSTSGVPSLVEDAREEATSESAPPLNPTGPIAEDVIREKLKEVIDPELFVNIIDLGLVYEVFRQNREDGKTNVGIEMTMTSPACPAGPQLVAQSKAVVASLPGVGDVEVRVVLDPPWTPDRMTDEARDRLGIF